MVKQQGLLADFGGYCSWSRCHFDFAFALGI